MKAKVELYGKQIGVNGNITRLIIEKEAKLLVTLTNDDNTSRSEFIIDRATAVSLVKDIVRSINDPQLKLHKFKVV